MGRKKIIYFSLLFILMVICTVTYFSYAFLIKTEEHHGKLNIVTGTLNYSLTADDLSNNQITVEPGKHQITVTLKSLNEIDSKYQLYYQSPSGVVVGYFDTNTSLGTINNNGQVTIDLVIDNTTSSNQTVTLGVEGGFTGNSLVLSQGTAITDKIEVCDYTQGQVFTFDYNGTNGTDGSVQRFNPKCDGTYKLETWGAQGGYSSSDTTDTRGGYGGYSVGNIDLTAGSKVYIAVGGQGKSCTVYGSSTSGTTTCGDDGGYNGGGSTRQYVSSTYYGSGGGATHMALDDGLLSTLSSHATDNRILIVSGGGGGASRYQPSQVQYNSPGGNAGGYTGAVAVYTLLDRSVTCNGGTQTAAGTGSDTVGQGFGHGGNLSQYVGPGGGAGYYGGGTSEVLSCGGSGYIGNTNLSSKAMYCYGCTESTATATKTVSTTGTSSYIDTTNCPNGYSSNPVSKCAKAGNGYARITYLGNTNDPPVINVSVDKAKATITITSLNDIYGYGVNQSSTQEPTYTVLNTENPTVTYTATSLGTYYVWAKDINGNINKKEFTITELPSCEYAINQQFNFSYTGSVQSFTPKCDGRYKLEVWGASGGSASTYTGGAGGYSKGTINLSKNTNMYVYAGQGGASGIVASSATSGTFGGGGGVYGATSTEKGTGGGGSDIRIGQDSLYARVIVAGGGGGASNNNSQHGTGGAGGGTSGIAATATDSARVGGVGTQTGSGSAPTETYYNSSFTAPAFGIGGTTSSSASSGGGGGGGWYGGWAGGGSGAGGSGGSGYVYTSSTASNYPSGCLLNSSYYLSDASTIAGNTSFTSPTGTNETGHSGNGYARITYLGD